VPFSAWHVHLRQPTFEDVLHSLALGRPWWLSSFTEWLRANFDVGAIWAKGQRRLILASLVFIWAAAVNFFIFLIGSFGIWGLIKLWLMPWIAYHFWKSAFLQSAYKVPFTDSEITVTISFPSKYPGWVKLLSNDFAFLLSGSRIFSHYIQEKSAQYIPNCNLAAAFNYVGLRGGYVLAVEDALLEEQEKAAISLEQRELDALKGRLSFGLPVESLPLMTLEEFKATGKARKLFLCDGIVFDVRDFCPSHPGGQTILDRFFGHDITALFNGDVYNHSNGARNLARHFMIARINKEKR